MTLNLIHCRLFLSLIIRVESVRKSWFVLCHCCSIAVIVKQKSLNYRRKMHQHLIAIENYFKFQHSIFYLGKRTLLTPEKCVLSDLGFAHAEFAMSSSMFSDSFCCSSCFLWYQVIMPFWVSASTTCMPEQCLIRPNRTDISLASICTFSPFDLSPEKTLREMGFETGDGPIAQNVQDNRAWTVRQQWHWFRNDFKPLIAVGKC